MYRVLYCNNEEIFEDLFGAAKRIHDALRYELNKSSFLTMESTKKGFRIFSAIDNYIDMFDIDLMKE